MLALVTSILANNLPDFDFVYTRITEGKLGYLLHHRGHTHTLPGAIGLGAVVLALAFVWASFRRIRLGRSERAGLAALALAGPLLHIALDYTNNYGVHPFWPLDDRWYYGDAVFIVEPLFWAVAIPPLALLAETRAARALLVALFGAGILYGATRLLSPTEVAALCGLAAAVTALCTLVRVEWRAPVGLGGWAFVLSVFVVEGEQVRHRALDTARLHFASTRVLEVVTTPRPANPFCWSLLVLGTEGGNYVARRGTVSVSPWASSCDGLYESSSTAPLRGIAIENRGVSLSREYTAPVEELRDLAKTNCRVAAFLRYARAPFWTEEEETLIVGDLRFDRSRALDFTDLAVPGSDVDCPRHVPPLKPPRSDLLE